MLLDFLPSSAVGDQAVAHYGRHRISKTVSTTLHGAKECTICAVSTTVEELVFLFDSHSFHRTSTDPARLRCFECLAIESRFQLQRRTGQTKFTPLAVVILQSPDFDYHTHFIPFTNVACGSSISFWPRLFSLESRLVQARFMCMSLLFVYHLSVCMYCV